MDGLVRRTDTDLQQLHTISLDEELTDPKREQRLRIAMVGLVAMNLFFICGVVTITALALGFVP